MAREKAEAPGRFLVGRKAIVRGAGHGLGRGIARGLAIDGADVAILEAELELAGAGSSSRCHFWPMVMALPPVVATPSKAPMQAHPSDVRN